MTIDEVREEIEFLLRANDARVHYSETDREFGVCKGVSLTCNKILHFIAQADRSPEGQDRVAGLGRNDESAVGSADAPEGKADLMERDGE